VPSRELGTALKQKLPVVTLLWYCARMAAGKFMGELG